MNTQIERSDFSADLKRLEASAMLLSIDYIY